MMYQHLSVQTKLKSDSLSKNYGFFSLSINQTNRRPSNTIKPTIKILILYYLLFWSDYDHNNKTKYILFSTSGICHTKLNYNWKKIQVEIGKLRVNDRNRFFLMFTTQNSFTNYLVMRHTLVSRKFQINCHLFEMIVDKGIFMLDRL